MAAAAVLAFVVSPASLETKFTSSPQAIFPNGFPSMDFARELIDSYGEGRIWPYYLMLDANEGDTVFSASPSKNSPRLPEITRGYPRLPEIRTSSSTRRATFCATSTPRSPRTRWLSSR